MARITTHTPYHVFEGAFVGTRIYVGNLPYSADDGQLQQLFSAYGNVVDARVITDRNTGQSKGFGFVEMSSDEEARSAIAGLNGTMLGNRALRLDEAAERPAGGRSGGGGGYGGGGGGGGRSGGGYGGGGGRRDDYSRGGQW
jgi:RNA recognition motif-containing protein